MVKVLKRYSLLVVLICVLLQASFIVSAANPTVNNPIVFKVAFTDPPTMKLGDKEVNHPSYAQMVAFKHAMDNYALGRVKVELYTNGRLGDNKSTIEQVLMGNLGATTPPDGMVAPFYKKIQVLSAPYVFKESSQLYDVVDGPFGRKLFNDMAAKSGLRVLSCIENGGFRSFSNNKKVVRVPADMKGLKIRTMESPIYMEIVKSTGASPTPVAFLELYSALQTGVVDGQENSPITMLGGSLQEVQKYYTLNKHVLGTGYLIASEKYLKSLPKDLQEAFVKAGREAAIAGRNQVHSCQDFALETLKKSGVNVYTPTPKEMKLWEKTQKPALDWLRKNIDPKLVEELLKTVKKQSSKKKQ
jgi:tripartite ATP-independent transporter DctP family solute receptor